MARETGFDFVDVKCCHGYLLHELLAAHTRPGPYGGSFENRTRFLRSVVERIRSEVPGLRVAVRFSAFDTVPYTKDPDGVGTPEEAPDDYDAAFGLLHDDDALDTALVDARLFMALLRDLKIRWVCVTAGSPYHNPHVQRPALFPPSDGYRPPEDPLVGVARQINAVAAVKAQFPDLALVGTGYSYLQEWLPNLLAAGHVPDPARAGDDDPRAMAAAIARPDPAWPERMAEAARLLGISRVTVRWHLSAARKDLRAMLLVRQGGSRGERDE